MDGVATQGPPPVSRLKSQAVMVTAADCNLALPWDKMFDGCPFSTWPDWIEAALQTGWITPHTTGGTDYAQWKVLVANGVWKNASPGDYIVQRRDGRLDVCEEELARAVRAA